MIAGRSPTRVSETIRPSNVEPIAEALAARNAADERTTPFVPADDSLVLDTSTMNAEDVFQAVLDVVRERMDEGSGSARP